LPLKIHKSGHQLLKPHTGMDSGSKQTTSPIRNKQWRSEVLHLHCCCSLGASLVSSVPSSYIHSFHHIISKQFTTERMYARQIKTEIVGRSGSNLHIRSPQSEIITKKLHYQSAILVWILSQRVQVSNGFVKSLIIA